jgi:ATP adenylyltransferase
LERENLWAPWRINYVQELDKKCENPQDDDKNLVLWRTEKSIVILNLYPYNNGHILIAPNRHIGELEKADDDELLDMFKLIRASQNALSLAIKPHGFNVGMNFGRCAGAGLPEHFHTHVVPRWDGDTNFMSVCSNTDIISQSLNELLELLKQVSKENNLPGL